MNITEKHQHIIDKLYGLYKSNGYINEDEALDIMVALKLPLNEIDIVTEHLLSLGVIIRSNISFLDDESEYDRSQIDYDELFNEVVSIDPSLAIFIDEVRRIQPPQHREWINLMPQAKNGNQYAYQRLIEMYLRVVIKIALSFTKKYNVPLADTIQSGCIGLITALDKFELDKKDIFSSYAPWWIWQAITKEMDFSPYPLLYFPAHYQEQLYSIYEIVSHHYCVHCENLDYCPNLVYDVCQKLSCTEQDAKNYLQYYFAYSSLEEQLEVNELIFSDEGLFEDELMQNIFLLQVKQTVHKAIKILTAREQEVISERYGLIDSQEKTLEEIGNSIGVTRERIRQIEAKALRKLSHSYKLKGFKVFF
jgi:RNA polymerase primary sigma factor